MGSTQNMVTVRQGNKIGGKRIRRAGVITRTIKWERLAQNRVVKWLKAVGRRLVGKERFTKVGSLQQSGQRVRGGRLSQRGRLGLRPSRPSPLPRSKPLLFLLLATLALALIAALVLIQKTRGTPAKLQSPFSNASQENSLIDSQQYTWDKNGVAEVLSNKLQTSTDNLVFAVTSAVDKDNKTFLYGGVGRKGVQEGYSFYVVFNKQTGEYTLAYLGTTPPTCEELREFNPPSEWECN